MSKSLNYDIVILTTAVTRPKLHSSVFKKINKILDGYNCRWIISIDKILNTSLNETRDNFFKILNYKNIDLTVRKHSNDASRMSWYKSVKYCINQGYKYNPSLGFLWLEDDWTFNSNKSLKHHIDSINNLPSKSFFISLANRSKELNFNPSIWSNDLYKKYMFTKINLAKPDDTGGNAERFVCYDNQSPESMKKINSHNFSLFEDVGRHWASEQISGKRTFN
tara:strand:+ start:1393 stop:2058 length:666 start_codon:yes stop_codon:yes gene_type:complete